PEFELARIAEDRSRDGAAEIDVEAGPYPLRIDLREAGKRIAAGADQMPAGTDGLEGRACRGRSLRQGRRDEQQGRGGRKDNKPQTHAAAPSCPGGIITTGTAGSSAAASRHSVQNLAEEQ